MQGNFVGKNFFLNVTKGAFGEKLQPGVQTHSFNEITGHLVNITFKDTAYGPAMRLHVVDQSNFYMLSMFLNSRPANAFFMAMRNLTLTQELTFKIRSVDGKDYFTVHQFGTTVVWYFVDEYLKELPREVELRKAYMKAIVENEIIPSLRKIPNPFPKHAIYKPMRKGLQGGYFDDYQSKGPIHKANPRENDPGFGKSVELW
jgi:hypothetical protein